MNKNFTYETVLQKFSTFKEKNQKNTLSKISTFFEEIKEEYLSVKTNEYVSSGINKQEAHNKARQSWRTFVGTS